VITVTDDGLRMPASQAEALHRIPAGDLLIDPVQLAAVLEEPASDGSVPSVALLLWTLASLVVTIGAAIWWVTAGY
jgi:hypothetical protein